jgi:hypothetical protein
MNEQAIHELTCQLQQVSRELDSTQVRLRGLESAQRLRASRTQAFRATTLVLAGLALAGVWLPRAEVRAAAEPTIVTRMQLPVLFQDKAGHTVLEVSDRPQHHGITLYSKSGEAVYIGADKQGNGLLMLETPAKTISSELSVDGFHLFGSNGKSVAFVGADSTGAGAIQLTNSTNGVVVDMGALGGKTGFVQVYPRSGKTPFPIPNYLQGGK